MGERAGLGGKRHDSADTALRTIPKRVVIGIAAAFVLLAVLIAAIQLVWARHHLLAGASQLNTAISVIRSPASLQSAGDRAKAIQSLEMARSNFAAARSDLDLWSPALARLRPLPRFGRQLSSASAVAGTAYFATAAALDVVDGVEPFFAGTKRAPARLLHRLTQTLAGGRQYFRQAIELADSATGSLRSVSPDLGSASLDTDIAKLRRELPRLRGAATWLALMPGILGDNQVQRYIFVWENSAEIRPTGGFIGAVDRISLRHGEMSKVFSGSSIEANRFPLVQPPVAEAATTRETTWIFRDSNASPSFPLSARLERWFYQRDTHVKIDGVIDFVDQGIPDILSATGPIFLRPYHVTLTAHNALRLANRFASARPVKYRGPHPPGKNLDTYRKQFLGFEFAAILKRLQRLPADRWGALGAAMRLAVERKDILLWSPRDSVEAAIRSSGADGGLSYVPGDFVAVYDDNRSYNKIAPYVRESASYQADLVQGYWLDSVLTIRYHLRPSPNWMEGFGPGLGTLGNKHEFRDFVRIYVPPGALVQSVPGLHQSVPLGYQGRTLASLGGYGLTQIAGWFTMSPNQTKILRVSYAVPANDLNIGGFRHYRLTVIRQPGTILRGIEARLVSVGGIAFQSANHRPVRKYTTWIPLNQSRSISLTLRGHEQPNLVTEPSPVQADPLIPTRQLRGLY